MRCMTGMQLLTGHTASRCLLGFVHIVYYPVTAAGSYSVILQRPVAGESFAQTSKRYLAFNCAHNVFELIFKLSWFWVNLWADNDGDKKNDDMGYIWRPNASILIITVLLSFFVFMLVTYLFSLIYVSSIPGLFQSWDHLIVEKIQYSAHITHSKFKLGEKIQLWQKYGCILTHQHAFPCSRIKLYPQHMAANDFSKQKIWEARHSFIMVQG